VGDRDDRRLLLGGDFAKEVQTMPAHSESSAAVGSSVQPVLRSLYSRSVRPQPPA
jgi:hypothetical protein